MVLGIGSVGKKVAVTGGFFYVLGDHPLANQYLCIQAGEIGWSKRHPLRKRYSSSLR